MAAGSVQFEVAQSEDAHRLPVTTIKCHGRLVSSNAKEIKDLVKPLVDGGGRHIIIDCGDLEYLDSSGLGALVSLKVSAVHKGLVKLELVNVTPRISELLRLTSLTELFSK